MADNVEIQGLEFQIVNDSTQAVAGLQNLINTLNRLKTATNGGATGLSKTAQGIRELSNSLKGLNSGDASQKITRLTNALTALSQVGNVKISSSIANQLTAINTALAGLKWTDGDKLTALANGLRPLSELGKANMTTFINQLSKLPKVIEDLDKADIGKFTQEMTALAAAMKPFADEMQKVSSGFSAFPSKIQKLITSTEKYNASASKATSTTGKFTSGLKALNVAAVAITFRRIGHYIAQAVTESNKYQEDLNLFTVALGQYADEAKEYAEYVSDIMGIDPAQWLRNQGIFNTLLTGFGDTAERAQLMSQNLTQLGYDLSSYANIPIEEAMLKLQSGISGELEPLRRLGYDLSQAKLQQTALNLGIKESVANMTQAEKAELRYYAIMTQVTTAQGDMARTLEAPANQLRILQAQVTQAARAIGNIFIPALNAILPYAIAVVQVIREIANALANLAGFKLTEVDYSGVNSAAVGAGALADNLDNAAGAAKKLKQYTAGFDELNIIPSSTNSGATGGGTGFDFELPTYDFLGDAVQTRVGEIKKMIEDSLAEIGFLLGTSLFALGGILLLTGHVGLGIGLMIAGGMMGVTAVASNWGGMTSEIQSELATIMEIVGTAFLAIGAILALTGHAPLGIAFIIAGASSLGGGAVIHWNALEDPIGTALDNLGTIVAGAMLALGAVLAFSGVKIPLGIALLAGGALALGSNAALNWDSLSDEVKGTLAIITASVSLALLAVGAILAFASPSHLPLGIALLAAGAVTMGTAIIPNWDTLPDNVKSTISAITAIVGVSLLAIGAILAFSTVNIPLGLGLMAVGALSLGTAAALNWDSVVNTIRKVVSVITSILGGSLIVLGVLLCLSGVGIGLGLAVLAAGLSLSYAAWTLDDNPITRFVKKMANSVIGIVNSVIDAINNMFHISFKGLSLLGKQVIPAFDVRLVNLSHIRTFADGGFVDQGQLFIAREAGAELVGSIGNRTAVANNDQIVEGITSGVKEGNSELISAMFAVASQVIQAVQENGGDIYLDSDKVGQKVTEYQNRKNRMYGKTLQTV